ncbi:MAG: DMT family transporter [Betaproteobacteria bacterium]|nr:MAG: DMT family transporter [Betaproteobacteria bacterium]TAG48547.1 MAG: DMT family transporter [Betaproteobacteria bacterium]
MTLSKQTIGVLYALVTVSIWVSFIILARVMAHKTLTPFDIGFVRFIAAALIMVPWGIWWVRRERAINPSAQSWLGMSPLSFKLSALVGIVGGIGYSCFAYSGFFFAPASHASVLMPGMLPLWTAMLAFFVLKTPVPPRRAIGLALIALGAVFVGGASVVQSLGGGDVWRGDVLFLCASFCWGSYTVIARKNALAAIPATMAISVFALVTYVPIYGVLAFTHSIHTQLFAAPWSEILLQGFLQGVLSVVISGITFVKMVEIFGPVRSTMITSVVPPMSALGAVFLLGEPLHWNLLVGLLLATIGIGFGVKSVTPTTPAAR